MRNRTDLRKGAAETVLSRVPLGKVVRVPVRAHGRRRCAGPPRCRVEDLGLRADLEHDVVACDLRGLRLPGLAAREVAEGEPWVCPARRERRINRQRSPSHPEPNYDRRGAAPHLPAKAQDWEYANREPNVARTFVAPSQWEGRRMNCKKCGRPTHDCQACNGGRATGMFGKLTCNKCNNTGRVCGEHGGHWK